MFFEGARFYYYSIPHSIPRSIPRSIPFHVPRFTFYHQRMVILVLRSFVLWAPTLLRIMIILNGQPTKSKIVWKSLVDVNNVQAAIQKINWLYKDVQNNCVQAAKEIIEVSNGATSTMLEKATFEDMAGFQAYTIRHLNNKLSTASDIDQYKLDRVRLGA